MRGIGEKPDLQKSSWTGFVSFYRVSLRPIVFYRTPFFLFRHGPSLDSYAILRDSAPRDKRHTRFTCCLDQKKKKWRNEYMNLRIAVGSRLIRCFDLLNSENSTNIRYVSVNFVAGLCTVIYSSLLFLGRPRRKWPCHLPVKLGKLWSNLSTDEFLNI